MRLRPARLANGEAESFAVQPAGFVFDVRVEAEGSCGLALIARQGLRELGGDGGIAGSREWNKEGSVTELGGEVVSTLAREKSHGPCTGFRREGK